MDKEAARAFITRLARTAGEVIKPYYFSADLEVESKADATPVTLADRAAEEAMRREIRAHHPAHGIIAEEFGNENEDAEWVWVLDPIDGTISFTSGCPLFGTLIGLLHQGRPVAGCIYQPVLEQLMIGDNDTTTLNGTPVRARDVKKLEHATLLTTDLAHIGLYQEAEGFDRLRRRCRLFRTWGDCYGYFLVAAGRADIMCDPVMNPWDLLPVVPVLRGAGVEVSAWNGGPVEGSRSCMAAHPSLHRQALRTLFPVTE